MRNVKRKKILVAASLVFLFFCGLPFMVNTLFPFPQESLQIEFSKVYYDRTGKLLGAKLSGDDKWRFQTGLDDVSPCLTAALLEFEDKRFFKHCGVDIAAVFRAAVQNAGSRRVVSGASTISMQVARLLEKKRRYGSFSGKVVQIIRALQLERRLSKKQILELYFNLAPYGGNIEGVAAASWFFFHRPPSKLTWEQAIVLAITPKSPNAYRPDIYSQKARTLSNFLKDRLVAKNEIGPAEAPIIDFSQIPVKMRPLPDLAPHFVNRVHHNLGNRGPLLNILENPGQNHVRTSLDYNMQWKIENILGRYVRRFDSSAIRHAAVLVMENKTGNIPVYIGSPDFENDELNGQFDGVMALRSPGSTLKPFVYAKAVESGNYNPRSLLPNVPLSYPGFRPENFNKDDIGFAFFGDALIRSLNIPAVHLDMNLERENDLYSFLRRSGVSTVINSREHYGYNIVLGGLDMHLDELVALYSIFPRGGGLIPASFLADSESRPSANLLTPEACFVIADILRKNPLPEYNVPSDYFRDTPDIAWKTGTSGKSKDAWSIGFNPEYTAGVWFGGHSKRKDMTGRNLAAPLLFEVFRVLANGRKSDWPGPPEDVIEKEVCELSGKLPTSTCPSTVKTWWIAGVAKPEFSKMHVDVLRHKITGKRLSPECVREKNIPGHLVETVPMIIWPREIAGWLAQKNLSILLPPYEKGCEPPEQLAGQPPKLQTPLDGERYVIESNPATHYAKFDRIPFSANVTNEVNFVEWFLDGKKIGKTRPGQDYAWKAVPGVHSLTVADDFGRMSHARFTVLLQKASY